MHTCILKFKVIAIYLWSTWTLWFLTFDAYAYRVLDFGFSAKAQLSDSETKNYISIRTQRLLLFQTAFNILASKAQMNHKWTD